MNYLLFICADGPPAPEELAVLQRECTAWVEEMDGRGLRLFGQELELPESAATVRVREGETLVTDGPFAEAKEFVAGFDLLSCDDLDEAIEVAAKHPSSWFQTVEIRPFAAGKMGPSAAGSSHASGGAIPTSTLNAAPRAGLRRYVLLHCADGIPASDEVEASIVRDATSWLEDATAQGAKVYGHALAHAHAATTVRVRSGETLVSDGPFLETKEFIAGFDIIDCASREQAIELAARHPLARHHMIEVRPFATD